MNPPAAPFRRPPFRWPFPLLLAAVCLLFAAIGVAVLDDYGIGWDEPEQRHLAELNAAYITGDGHALPRYRDRFHGIVFELPLLLVERLLGLEDSRDIYLSRHLLTHLFFIAGGFFCGLLAWRMFHNRWLALLAMLLFLLHPRLYAHSFFNSKDIPFAALFVIALYLTHRAFRRDTLGAFALLGLAVGLAVNLRPFALLLLPAVLALRGLDWRHAAAGDARRRILLTGGVFAAAALLTLYASHPYYWENPLRFIEGLQILSRFPLREGNLFQGQIILADAAPASYIPVWFGITAPPAALLLGLAGMAAVLWRGIRAPGAWLWRPGELRFLLLLLGCFTLPVAVVILAQSHIYNGWRHLYFLWGPFCLLAAAALPRRLAWPGRGLTRSLRLALWGLAAAALGGAAYAIVSLHPHQQVYFNLLVNRAAPGELRQQYDMDYWLSPFLQGLEYLLERYPDTTLHIPDRVRLDRQRMLLPAAERERIALSDVWETNFQILSDRNMRQRTEPPGTVLYRRQAYGSAYLMVVAPRLVWGAGPDPGAAVYRAAYQRVTAAAGPAARADFDVYLHDGALYYVKENCRPEDAAPPVFLHLFPVNDADLPNARREYGFDNRDFHFGWRGGFFDGKCITQEPLPDYPLARIRTGQIDSGGETRWQADLNPYLMGRFQEIEARLAGLRPAAAAGGFELYLDGGRLLYRREPCAAADVVARFYLHLFPADAAELPADRQAHGFVNRGFSFPEYGIIRGGKCLAAAPLPDYPLARIRTGQYAGGETLWQAELHPPDLGRFQEIEAGLAGWRPAAGGRAVSGRRQSARSLAGARFRQPGAVSRKAG